MILARFLNWLADRRQRRIDEWLDRLQSEQRK